MDLLKTKVGWFRIVAFLEGSSLLLLVFIAVPLKYLFDNPSLVKSLGPLHGALFVLFLMFIVPISIEHKWKIGRIIKVALSSFVPFGTFYMDKKVFSKM